MIRCPNLRDDKVREDFNGVLARLGGVAMAAEHIAPRQPYLSSLNEAQITAYNTAHFLWNEYGSAKPIGKFLDALDQVKAALEAKAPAATKPEDEDSFTLAQREQQIEEQKKKVERLEKRIARTKETGRDPLVKDEQLGDAKVALPALEQDLRAARDMLTILDRTRTKHQDYKAPEPEAGPLSNLPAIDLAKSLLARLESGKPITAKIMQEEAATAYGAKLAEGKFDRKDMQDALELAVNMHVIDTRHLRVDSPDPQHAMKMLGDVLDGLPTQRVRSEEMERFQQFSTPPTYAAAAAYAANLRSGDVMLEPSAGTGSLIAASAAPGVRFVANELSERRAALLRSLIGDRGRVFSENAEQLNNVLPDDVKPTIVVMNPPFSQTAGRMGDRKMIMTAAVHIEQALKRLEPGGRLVAIVGRGMTMGAPTYRAWWDKIGKEYAVRANIGVDGKVYEKYGTAFGSRLLVIDKVKPTGEAPALVEAQTVDDLMRALEPIRNARDQVDTREQQPAESRGVEVGEGGERAGAGALPAPVEPGNVGAGERGERGVAGSRPARDRGAGGGDARVEAGERDGLARVEPERPGPRAADEPAERDKPGKEPEAGRRPGARRDLQPDAGGQLDPAARAEHIELEHAEPGSQAAAAEISDSLYDNYEPQRVRVAGAKPHPGPLVESAAMASVPPPKPSYTPHLPRKVIDKGLLSNAQIEPVIYAGEAHAKMLPAAEGVTAKRRGYFIGDGTGVGKGREVAGIILDNWQQGRRKAVWVSEKRTLIQDAKRDWTGLEQNGGVIFDLGKIKAGEPVTAKHGIAFVTYDTLKGGMSDQAALARGNFVRKQQVSVNGQGGTVQRVEKGGRNEADKITVNLDNGTQVTVPANEVSTVGKKHAVKSRVDQLVEWFGEDFDGVIAFDEAHNMGNATDIKGDRQMKEAALKALAGMALQDRLPNARVVYVSATGATEVSNLAYADRLGLWGRGTPFATREKFVTEVEKGGIAAMELIARDMKQLGLYTARNLSYDGVEYARIEHKLDANQREIYDKLAEAWQVVLKNINAALTKTGGEMDSRARSAAMSAFWGGHQRFFNQIVTSMQMPSVIKAVEKDLAEGRQAVLQLTNTNEASQERAAAKAKSAEEIEDLDITPRDQIIQLVEKSFPTQQYEEYIDDGKERSRPVVDSAGNPVQNKEAVAMRDALIEHLASVRVPQGPLDMVLDHFGTDVVAEVTGRGRRFVRKPDERTGQMRRVEESRPGSSNIAETDAFQSGKKKVLVFSEAGGTGRSYHADNTAESRGARRSHYLVQGGWRADKAVQGFGRTHRTNQASAPIFNLVTTDLQGQKRFISSIARRLAQLGALTKGERKAGDQGVFSARDNLESTEARQALTQFYKDVVDGKIEGVPVADFEQQTGLRLRKTDDEGRDMGMLQELPPITQFLNRLLSLKINLQNAVFDAFSERLDAVIDARRQAGLLDVGMETVKAEKITKDSEQVVHKVEGTDADTKYMKFTLADRFEPTPFEKVANNEWRKVVFWAESPNGKVYAVAEAPALTDDGGKIIENYRLLSPVSDARMVERFNLDRPDTKWKKIEKTLAKLKWNDEIDRAPEFVTRDLHLVTGAILPIWDRLRGNPRVVRLQTNSGERFIGRVIPKDGLAATLKALGATATSTEGKDVKPGDLFEALMAGRRATLANGWTLKRALVAGEHRIELKGPTSFTEGQDAKRDGVFTEKIDYKVRYFIPTDAATGIETLKKLTQYRPVSDLSDAHATPDDMAAGDEMFSIADAEGDFGEGGEVRAFPSFQPDFIEHAKDVFPLLRQELDRLGLHDIGLKLANEIALWVKGKQTARVDAVYFQKAIILALDSDNKFRTLQHEALHGLRRLGVFTDSEWSVLERASNERWRKQFNIERDYGNRSAEIQTEEGIARAYAAWADGELKPDGRIARWFKRIRSFLEAVRNAFRGLGFKTAEDVFRDIRSGEVGGRARAKAGREEPMYSIRRPAGAGAPAPKLNTYIRDRIAEVLDHRLVHKFIEGTQDLSHPVKRLEEALQRRAAGPFDDARDFYTRKRLYPGRLGAWVDTFNKKHLDPIVKLLKANEIDLDAAGDYLYARHATERNEAMDRINPRLGGEGSGMSSEEAKKIIDEAKRSGSAAAYDELRDQVGRIRDLVLTVMEKAGLEKPEVIAEWRKQYNDYVPLKGWEDAPEDAPPEYRTGKGFNVRGREVHKAFGRRSKADNPLVNIIEQAYRTFDRAERNRYLQSLYRAIDQVKDDSEDVATLDRGRPKKEIDRKTGLVRTVETSNQYANPNAVYLKFDGDPHFIVFADREMAEAVKRMSPASLGVFEPVLRLQNKLKALWTHYSPDFLFRHFIFRYPIEGTLNSFEQKESGEHKVSQYIKDALPFLGNASKAIFASNKGRAAEDAKLAEMQKYWEEMKRAGGAMVFRNMRDMDLLREHLETALKDLSKRPMQNARAKWRHAIEAMDVVTNALDNSLRLAAYASARKQGKTPQQAALIAREATVDFQLKGNWSNAIGLWFVFGNVAIQTGMRMAKAVARSKMMRRVFLGSMLTGFLTAAYNYLVYGEDKDGVPFFEKIPEWERRLNFIVLTPAKDDKGRPQPIKIPMPYNWAMPLALGYAFGTTVFGKESTRKTLAMVTKSVLETLTPFGSEQNKAAAMVPEMGRPFVHVYTNEDWAGRPIHNDRFQKGPNAFTARRTTGEGWKDIAQGVNTATGGSRAKSGVIDLYPEDYREFIGHFVGTQLRFGANIIDTAKSIAEGKAPKPTTTPLERVIFGSDYDAADRARGYELRDQQKKPWMRR